MRKITLLLAALLVALCVAQPAVAYPIELEKTKMFYVVAAHPDDEPNIWSMIQSLDPWTYTVFVNFTRGEGTASCMRKEDAQNGTYATEELEFVEGFDAAINGEVAWGPYKYQGPNSPVDELNEGETRPIIDPWEGQGSKECKKARVASWHWFMDDMHELDGSGTSFEIGAGNNPWADDDFMGEFCPEVDGHPSPDHTTHPGNDPKDKHTVAPLWDPALGCVEVWADEHGARVSFDLGNTNSIPLPDGSWTFDEGLFDEHDVVAAIQLVLEGGADWGISDLPKAGMASASGYEDEAHCPFHDKNPDHLAVQKAVMHRDFNVGPQCQGMVCHADASYAGAVIEPRVMRPDTLFLSQWVDPRDDMRIGPFNKHYGWLFSTYVYFKSAETYLRVFD